MYDFPVYQASENIKISSRRVVVCSWAGNRNKTERWYKAMECPTEVASLLLKIIGLALLNVRGFGFTKADANRCAIEADHVHNLPGLIENYSTIALRYYLDVARPEYCRLVANEPGMIKLFEPAWSQLDEYARADR